MLRIFLFLILLIIFAKPIGRLLSEFVRVLIGTLLVLIVVIMSLAPFIVIGAVIYGLFFW